MTRRSCAPCGATPSRRWPSRCAITAVVMVLLALVLLAGCSVPSDDEAQAIDPSRLESTATTKRTCASQGLDGQAATVNVFLVSQQSDPPNVKPVLRIVEDADGPSAFVALEALFECIVTQDERRAGLASAIPDETRLLALRPVDLAGGTYEVQLGPLRNRGGQKVDDLDKLAVAQIFFTATGSDPEVKGLRFTIDGRAVAVNTDRRTVGQTDPVTREDFVASSPPAPTTSTTPSTTPSTTAAPAGPTTTVRSGSPTTAAAPATTVRSGSPTTTAVGSSATLAPGTTR
jgi:spore germination protein GerM